MYYCSECLTEFKEPEKIIETHGLNEPPFEVFLVCPHCKSKAFYIKNVTHCRCCGAKLTGGAIEYCSEECRRKSLKLRKEHLRRKLLTANSSLGKITSELFIQNQRYGTVYSYGQYVAILSAVEKKAKCKKKRNT